MTNKNALILAVVCACASSAVLANPVRQAGVGGAGNFSPLGEGSTVLYDQTSSPAGNGAPVQNFEPAFDIYDAQGADDFDVTAPGWTINRVNFVITQSASGIPASVDVAIHSNVSGGGNPDLPGAAVCSYPGVAAGQTGTPASAFNVTLPTPCVLAPGRYWVSLIANQNFGGGGGQVFWSNRTVQSFSESAWRNPGGGFATPCANFGPQRTCGVGGGVNPDFLFQIVGAEGGLEAPLAAPSMNAWGLGLMAGLLALFGFVAVRRFS